MVTAVLKGHCMFSLVESAIGAREDALPKGGRKRQAALTVV